MVPPLQEVSEHPLVTLYGHDSEVLCVDISTELDMAVSGAKVCHHHHYHTLPLSHPPSITGRYMYSPYCM